MASTAACVLGALVKPHLQKALNFKTLVLLKRNGPWPSDRGLARDPDGRRRRRTVHCLDGAATYNRSPLVARSDQPRAVSSGLGRARTVRLIDIARTCTGNRASLRTSRQVHCCSTGLGLSCRAACNHWLLIRIKLPIPMVHWPEHSTEAKAALKQSILATTVIHMP